MARLSLTQGLSLPVTAHDALPSVGIKPVEGSEKGFAANKCPEALDIALPGETHEPRRQDPQNPSLTSCLALARVPSKSMGRAP